MAKKYKQCSLKIKRDNIVLIGYALLPICPTSGIIIIDARMQFDMNETFFKKIIEFSTFASQSVGKSFEIARIFNKTNCHHPAQIDPRKIANMDEDYDQLPSSAADDDLSLPKGK